MDTNQGNAQFAAALVVVVAGVDAAAAATPNPRQLTLSCHAVVRQKPPRVGEAAVCSAPRRLGHAIRQHPSRDVRLSRRQQRLKFLDRLRVETSSRRLHDQLRQRRGGVLLCRANLDVRLAHGSSAGVVYDSLNFRLSIVPCIR